ncbi:hypothetical protein LSF60_10070 [Rhodococcus pyridinivorans]|uniref:hypothetical protein n=1 Tax=Rhodococcus pyridinivorans TaxID=103816 RepID=UPI001E34A38A|nr:hypothetical protein [Rhodococcus pyridinivorans]UGQ59784.1 hypothetical protein LSF60_10070 [Rhodococcus pyridinivorans]
MDVTVKASPFDRLFQRFEIDPIVHIEGGCQQVLDVLELRGDQRVFLGCLRLSLRYVCDLRFLLQPGTIGSCRTLCCCLGAFSLTCGSLHGSNGPVVLPDCCPLLLRLSLRSQPLLMLEFGEEPTSSCHTS